MSKLLLQITVSPKLEDTVVDWLLNQPQQLVFTCYKVNQYGKALESATDHVRGYQQKIIFDVEVNTLDWEALKTSLLKEFPSKQLSYRALQIQDGGPTED